MPRPIPPIVSLPSAGRRDAPVRCWEPLEIEFTVHTNTPNPYADLCIWIDLEGPETSRRIYGFWDGEATFRVRLVAQTPGDYSWSAFGEPPGVVNEPLSGSFTAVDWTPQERAANPLRRGFLKPSENGRGFDHADGTPFFLLGDTWWAAPTNRYPWDPTHPIGKLPPRSPSSVSTPGPGMSFQSMVEYRRAQGFNAIAILAVFPHWANDGHPEKIVDADGLSIRDAWAKPGTARAKEMENDGGRPFAFPGLVPGYEDVVPNLDLVNPAYFRQLDQKIEFLNSRGIIPFVEVSRRDISQVWKQYHQWPESYGRFVQYLFARLQAFNCLLSPIHFDWAEHALPSREFNLPANWVMEKFGPPPFGTLLSSNSSPSTLVNFGGPEEARWLTFHQTGNWREHDHYWYATEIYWSKPPRPCISGEPYYPGFPDDQPPAPSDEATTNFRSGMYGGFLSGSFAGYIYGAEGMWGGDTEPKARYRTWEALQFPSGAQVRHLKTFAEVRGVRYRDLVPSAELITPNKSGPALGYRGWAFLAATATRDLALGYLEAECPSVTLRSMKPNTPYQLQWFDPRSGVWIPASGDPGNTYQTGRMELPPSPSEQDWGFMVEEIV